DRGFDPHVERTRTRPLASGRLNVKEALLVFVTLSSLAFVLVLFLNTFTIVLSVVGILLAGVYPFVKRVSHFPQVVLGLAFGWGAVMAWTAVTGGLGAAALLIFAANIFWSTAYDTIYALMDIEDDLKIGVKSTAIFFGKKVYLALVVLYLAFAALLAAAGYAARMGSVYYSGVVISLGAFLWMVAELKKNPTRETAFRGFLGNAAVGGLILVFILIDLNL
ncbi:MAG TPA: 4-hydroxybenzoate octaprenyltransferase, partial [Thermodesulfobacteriota bacterium]|nr:4-hydroxybenzoate octaprenyltransferase [Thermodesulfobacteriota bacterium]